jgi:hypothetical protein
VITIEAADAKGASGTTSRTKKFSVKLNKNGVTLLSVAAWPSAGKWAVTWPKALAAGTYNVVAGTGSKVFTVAEAPPPPSKLFPDSPFWVPVGGSPKIDPNSAAYVAHLLGQGPWGNGVRGTELTKADWTRPYYEATASDPTHVVDGGMGGSWTEPPPIEGATIHVPAGARPAGGQYALANDGGVFILQPDRKLFSAWRSVDPVDGRAYQWNMINGNGSGVPGGGEGGIGQAKLGPRIGQVTYDDLVVSKEIPHALVFEVNQWHGRRWPGWPGDAKDPDRGGYTSNTNAPPMGAHFWLSMSPTEIDALPVKDWKKVILRAMAVYGMYTYDNGGAARSLDWESAIPQMGGDPNGPNRWVEWCQSIGAPSHFDGNAGKTVWSLDIQSDVPWDRLKVVV